MSQKVHDYSVNGVGVGGTAEITCPHKVLQLDNNGAHEHI